MLGVVAGRTQAETVAPSMRVSYVHTAENRPIARAPTEGHPPWESSALAPRSTPSFQIIIGAITWNHAGLVFERDLAVELVDDGCAEPDVYSSKRGGADRPRSTNLRVAIGDPDTRPTPTTPSPLRDVKRRSPRLGPVPTPCARARLEQPVSELGPRS